MNDKNIPFHRNTHNFFFSSSEWPYQILICKICPQAYRITNKTKANNHLKRVLFKQDLFHWKYHVSLSFPSLLVISLALSKDTGHMNPRKSCFKSEWSPVQKWGQMQLCEWNWLTSGIGCVNTESNFLFHCWSALRAELTKLYCQSQMENGGLYYPIPCASHTWTWWVYEGNLKTYWG